jgi:hypothetical protein
METVECEWIQTEFHGTPRKQNVIKTKAHLASLELSGLVWNVLWRGGIRTAKKYFLYMHVAVRKFFAT